MKWVAALTILLPGVAVLSALAGLTLRVVQVSHMIHVPRWIAPYLIPALLAIDAGIAIGVVAAGITLLSMRTE